MWQESAKFLPKLLAMEQKQLHVKVLQDMLNCSNGKRDLRYSTMILFKKKNVSFLREIILWNRKKMIYLITPETVVIIFALQMISVKKFHFIY